MELRHLRYFLVLAEELNFTRAAERLMIAQPPLSRQIRDLEEELGAPLFVRQHHSVRLTDEGVLFRDYASRIIALADQSVSDIRNMRSGLQGTLYLAEVEGKGPRLMAEWIAGFSRLHPKVQFSVWNGNSDEVVNRVRKGLSDAALIMEPHDRTQSPGSPCFRRIIRWQPRIRILCPCGNWQTVTSSSPPGIPG